MKADKIVPLRDSDSDNWLQRRWNSPKDYPYYQYEERFTKKEGNI